MRIPSFTEFTEFIREWAGLSKKKVIAPETLLEDDLGITGDDGCDLLEATEKRFGVRLSDSETGYRRTFNLGANEFLFHSEGLFAPSLSGSVRAFTVGELYDAVKRASATNVQGEL